MRDCWDLRLFMYAKDREQAALDTTDTDSPDSPDYPASPDSPANDVSQFQDPPQAVPLDLRSPKKEN